MVPVLADQRRHAVRTPQHLAGAEDPGARLQLAAFARHGRATSSMNTPNTSITNPHHMLICPPFVNAAFTADGSRNPYPVRSSPRSAAKRLGQPRGVMGRPRDERAVGPEAAVGDEQMQVRMPVGARTVRLQAGDDAHREFALAGQRTDGRRHGVGGDGRCHRAGGGDRGNTRAAAWGW